MNSPPPIPGPSRTRRPWLRNLYFIALSLIGLALLSGTLWQSHQVGEPTPAETPRPYSQMEVVQQMDTYFAETWAEQKLVPAPLATDELVARRLSLALTGTIPSFEELLSLAQQPEDERLQWWLSHLFEDPRYADYTAERLARAYVGTEPGPFILYRRRLFVHWLSSQLAENRPYHELVQSLVTSEGVWTSNPEANFITVAMEKNEKTDRQEANPIKLTTRVSRAFLGIRIDCVECHDDKFGEFWKQEDFHQLAAFFGPVENSVSGVRDNAEDSYSYRYRGERKEASVPAVVPFAQELLPEDGPIRQRLAHWITHPENRAFARATINRLWAHLFGKPLVEPIDDIPLHGPWPLPMELLADELISSDYDLQHVLRILAETRVFQLASQSANPEQPVTQAHEAAWASFPLTRLRPEQVAQSVIQASSLQTLDSETHVFQRIARFGQTNDFVNRYGDAGASEFETQAGTIPQRLLLMNGELLDERTKENMVNNAATRIGALSNSDTQAVESAYLAILSRLPTQPELTHFASLLKDTKGSKRADAMQDLFWALMNSTEFSWNH